MIYKPNGAPGESRPTMDKGGNGPQVASQAHGPGEKLKGASAAM